MGKLLNKSMVMVLGAILIGVISWAFYNLINQGASDVLAWFGIENFYLQVVIIIIVGVLLLLLLGWSAKKVVKGMIS